MSPQTASDLLNCGHGDTHPSQCWVPAAREYAADSVALVLDALEAAVRDMDDRPTQYTKEPAGFRDGLAAVLQAIQQQRSKP
jgi:hypothetical protein